MLVFWLITELAQLVLNSDKLIWLMGSPTEWIFSGAGQ